MTLLDEAKKIKMGRAWTKGTPEDVDLVIAYFKNEVTATQIQTVKNFAHGSLYCYIVAIIQYGIANSLIKILKENEDKQ